MKGNETPSTSELVAALQTEMQALDAVLAQLPVVATDDVPSPDPERAREVLEQLVSLLASYDTAASDLFEGTQPLLLATHGAAATMKLERQVTAFDYQSALATVRNLLGQKTD
jgi:hypothetical protein